MKTELEKFAKDKNHEDSEAAVVVIMSHGIAGDLICGSDYDVNDKDKTCLSYREMIEELDDEKCPSLVGKPKIFIIHACRGDEVSDVLHIPAGPAQLTSRSVEIPKGSDMLLVFSTHENYVSWDSKCYPDFIQTLNNILKTCNGPQDILDILFKVERNLRAVVVAPISVGGKTQTCMSMSVRLLGWRGKFYMEHNKSKIGQASVPQCLPITKANVPNDDDEELWVIGGNGDPEVLSPDRKSWILRPNTGLEKNDLVIYNSQDQDPVFIHRNGKYDFEKNLHAWNRQQQTTQELISLKRERFAHAYIDGKVYIMGGNDNVSADLCEVYDKKKFEGSWIKPFWSHTGLLKHRSSGINAVIVNGKIYITPGREDKPSDKLDCQDPGEAEWERVSLKMKVKRACHALAEHDGQIWAFGGTNCQDALSDVESCDPLNGSCWDVRPKMSTARRDLSVTCFKGKFYAIGGSIKKNGTNHNLDVVEIFDPQDNEWKTGPRLNKARSGHCSVVLKKV